MPSQLNAIQLPDAQYDFTLELTLRELQLIAGGLALVFADEQAHRDKFAAAAERPTSNPRRAEMFTDSSEAAGRNMSEIEALVATLPEFGQQSYATELRQLDDRLVRP